MGGHDDARDGDHVEVLVVFRFRVVVEIISVECFFMFLTVLGYVGRAVQSTSTFFTRNLDIVLMCFAHSLEGQLQATNDEEKRVVCGCEKISLGIFTATYVVSNLCQKQNETHANDNQEGQQRIKKTSSR